MAAVAHEKGSQRVALHIRVVGKDAGGRNNERHVFRRGVTVVVGHGRVVHGRNIDGDRGEIAIGGAVVGAVGEGVASDVYKRQEVSEAAVGVEIQHSMTDVTYEHRSQRVAFYIRVVGKNARSCDGQTNVFQCGVSVVYRDRRVVHGRNINRDRGEITVGGAVVGAVGESVAAVVVGGGEVSEATVGVEIQHSMTDVTYENRGQRVAFHIRVVGENARSRDGQLDVFKSRVSIIVGDGRVIHRNDGDRHRAGGRSGAIGNGVVEDHRAVEICGGRENDVGAADDSGAICRGGAGYSQGQAIGIVVVGENFDGHTRVFQRIGAVINRDHWIVYRGDVDGDRGEIAVGGAVVGAVGKAVAAVVVGGREVSEAAVGVEIQHSMTDVTYENCGQRVALHIRIVGKNAGRGGNNERHVFQRGICVVVAGGRVIHRNDGDRHRAGGRSGAIGNGVVEDHRAVEICGGRENDVGAADDSGAICRGGAGYSQGQAIGIVVVGENFDGHTRVFQRIGAVINRDHWIVYRGDVDGDRGEIAVGGAVVGAVGKAVAAVVVGGREVSEAAVGVEIQHSMTDVTYENCGQRVALHIRIVGKNAGRGGNNERHVFQRNICVVVAGGRVIHRNDGDRHRAGGRSGAIGNGVVEDHRAVEICGGRENDVGAADDSGAVSGG